MNQKIELFLSEKISTLYAFRLQDIKLTPPPKKEMGDFAFGCFVLAKDICKSPLDISREIVESISGEEKKQYGFSKIISEGPYVNFFLTSENIAQDFAVSMQNKDFFYGDISEKSGETIVIDYIGANVGKPLHIGHMCTPNQGQVLINLFQKMGYQVISDSHIGDWGIIFGKLIVAYAKYGDEKKLEENAVQHLFELYVKISEDAEKDSDLEQEFRDTFKKLSSGDSKMIQIWNKFTKKSIEAMNIQLGKLGVKPLYNIGESFYEGLGLPKMENYPDLEFSMHEIVEELVEKGIATKNGDNSVGVEFPDESKIPSCILQKRDGTHGYLASDLACIKYRMHNWKPEKILYFVDVRQQLHFRQAFFIAKNAGWLGGDTELTHAHNGFISLKDGAMSTRKGKIIKLEDLFDEAKSRAKKIIQEKRDDISPEILEKLSEVIGYGAIKYGYLKKSRTTDVIFDWDEFMSFEGNSGPYIQYAYVRAKKLAAKSGVTPNFSDFILSSSEENKLAQKILEFPKTLRELSENYFPHVLCNYVYELTKLFSAMYNNVGILSEVDEKVKNSRIVLILQFMRVIEESFEILAIDLPDEM